jgi:hypothetical protein
MAIPTGTTSRQLHAVLGWILTGVVGIGMLTWWWPGYPTWGGVVMGLLLVWALWLAWRTLSGDGTVPGNPVHLALLGPAVILTYHLARSGLGTATAREGTLAGEINISMLFQIAALSLTVLLTQSLLVSVSRRGMHVSFCGAAMMGGSAAAMIWGHAESVPHSLAPLGLAGVAVWLTPLWSDHRDSAITVTGVLNSPARLMRVGVAVIAACLLIQASPPRGVFLSAGAVGCVLLLAGLGFRRYRAVTLSAGILAAGGCILPLAMGLVKLPDFRLLDLTWFGGGEQSIRHISSAGGGVLVLLGSVGPVGLLWSVICLAASLGWLLIRSGSIGSVRQWRAIFWTMASALVGCSLLVGGGLVIPACTLAAGFVWGLLPAMLGRAGRSRNGAIVLACLLAMTVLLGLARKDGLVAWSVMSFGMADNFLHAVTGFILAMVVAWTVGRRKVALGLAGIGATALAGGLGELLQAVASLRTAEWRDWITHALGCAAALAPYLLAMGARLCESADARRPTGEDD